MRKTLGVAALMLALCCPALAGEIPNPPAPSDGTIHTGSPAQSNGTMHTDEPTPTAEDSIIYGDNTDALTQIMLTLLVSVLP